MSETFEPIEVFCSYAHKDEAWRRKLDTYLSLLQQQGLISVWHDRQIVPGTDWAQTIDDHLDSASLILLLISPDFMASNYCIGIEMERALQRQRANEARVVPILLHHVEQWETAPFAHLQVLPTGAQFLATWDDEDAAFADVTAGIRRSLEDLALLTASLPRSGLPALWNVPFAPNPFFLGRDEQLAHLRTQLQMHRASAISQPRAISGLGGIGKTQIAVEYAYRHRQDYRAVFWLRAGSREDLLSSYAQLASVLNLPEKDEQEQEVIVQAVKVWLQRHRDWLLIFDNADEPDLLPPFLPIQAGGHIVVTTRSTVVGSLGISNPLTLAPFTAEQGALLLLRRAARLTPEKALEQSSPEEVLLAQHLSDELGGLPLALDQAGAYLEATGSSLADYLSLSQRRRADLLKQHRSHDYPNSVATTWTLSFERVAARNPAAAEFLRFCAFLASDAIPEEMITGGAEELGPILSPVAADPYLLNEAIEVLRAYSLIDRDPQARTLTIHRLVQVVLRDSMPIETQQQWTQRIVLAVNAAFPSIEFANWSALERLLPHALACAIWIERTADTSLEASVLLDQVGHYLRQRARNREAEPLLRQALAIREQELGAMHPDTATSLNNLAELYLSQGKYREAEPLYRRALAIREQELGAMHPDTAASLNNLAELYTEQGKYREAELLHQRALAIREQELGAMHPDTANSLNNLAGLYLDQGKDKEAEPLYQRALSINEERLGISHSETVISLSNLAGLYHRQRKYEEAEPLLARVLEFREKILGAMHPDTALSLNNLAVLYRNQGRYAKAEPLLRRALAIRQQELGATHPSTALSLNNLAKLYYLQGKYEEAEPLYQRALAIRQQELGATHPDTALSLNNLAELSIIQEKYAEAEPLVLQALLIREQELGANHPDTAQSLNSLAELYRAQGKYAEAEPLYQRALSIREQKLGTSHPDTATSLNNLAVLFYTQGKYAEAEALFQRAFTLREQAFGSEHPDTANSLWWLAVVSEQQQHYQKTKALYQRALSIYERTLGSEHPTTQSVQQRYTALLRTMKQDDAASA